MQSRAVRRSEGFTLLEIIVAIALTALLVTFAFQSVTSLSRAQERTLEENERDRLAEVVLDRMERELAGTLLLVKPEDLPEEDHPWIFTAIDEVAQGEDADSLRFVTETPARVADAAIGGGFRIVSYALRTNVDGGSNLYRTEEAFPEKRELDLPPFEDPPAVRDVAKFNVEAVDDESPRRLDSWDSTEAQADRLPSAVELTLQLRSRSADGELIAGRVFKRSIPLLVRPIGGEEDEDCAGPSVSECLSRFTDVLASLGPEAEEAIDALQEEVPGGSCFETAIGTPAGQTLVAQLEELTQLDPNEICQ